MSHWREEKPRATFSNMPLAIVLGVAVWIVLGLAFWELARW